MAGVSFRTSSGKKVSFQTKKRKRAPNAFAKFVKQNIGKYLSKGATLAQGRRAMKQVAADYRSKRGSAKRAGSKRR